MNLQNDTPPLDESSYSSQEEIFAKSLLKRRGDREAVVCVKIPSLEKRGVLSPFSLKRRG